MRHAYLDLTVIYPTTQVLESLKNFGKFTDIVKGLHINFSKGINNIIISVEYSNLSTLQDFLKYILNYQKIDMLHINECKDFIHVMDLIEEYIDCIIEIKLTDAEFKLDNKSVYDSLLNIIKEGSHAQIYNPHVFTDDVFVYYLEDNSLDSEDLAKLVNKYNYIIKMEGR